MYNILITGSNGFVGKNLIQYLTNNNEINILTFTRDNTLNDLENLIKKSDFIFHLAGEVRPDSSEDDFNKSNAILTKSIVDILEKLGKKIPILLASTIHAKLLKNEYGKSKRVSEKTIEEYSINNKIQCSIYRLPHVFGEGCKANYNSVISTWIYNSINNLDVNVFDRSIEMHYVYVQDIVKEFLENLKTNNSKLYKEPKYIYDTTLGEVVDYINEFKETSNELVEFDNEFKQKLYQTYKDYEVKVLNG
jgi:UDP-2-acetamido-2,6-beta-L-arabino-hexul-4-ose reductase